MGLPSEKALEREKDRLYLTDAQLIRRLGVPEKAFRKTLKELDANPRSGFPPKNSMFGNLRYWPAVEAWFGANHAKHNKPKSAEEIEGTIYFLASPTHIKIGFSAELKQRLGNLRGSHYEKLELLGTIHNAPKSFEGLLHKKFAAHRVHPRKEWFLRVPEIENFARDKKQRYQWWQEML